MKPIDINQKSQSWIEWASSSAGQKTLKFMFDLQAEVDERHKKNPMPIVKDQSRDKKSNKE